MSAPPFVLVHGACHQAAHWTPVVERLNARGRRAIAVSLPGHPVSDGTATLDDAINAVCVQIAAAGEPVILVGHSLGGMSVAGAAERMPDRVARVDFLAALLPCNGESAAMIGTGEGFVAGASMSLDDLGRVVPQISRLRDIFYDNQPQECWQDAVGNLCATDPGYLSRPVTLSTQGFGNVRKRYILCLRDGSILPDTQRVLAAKWPNVEVVELDEGHVAPTTAPDALVDILLS